MEQITNIVKQQNPLCEDITSSIKTIQTALSKLDINNKTIEKIYEHYNYNEVKNRMNHCLNEIEILKSTLNNVSKENEHLQKKITNKTHNEKIMEMLIQINDNVNSMKNNIIAKPKEIKNEETQTDFLKEYSQQTINQPSPKIEGIHHYMNLNNIHTSNPYALIELSDKRIASGGGDGSLLVCSINLTTKEWKQDVKKDKAHDSTIRSICELEQNRLISASCDKTIKIWNILKNELSLIQTLKSHTETVAHVIPLSHQRFASSSHDNNIKIWRSEETYDEITTLNLAGYANSMIKLKNKEILVSTSYSPDYIEFWNLNTYQKEHSIKGYIAVYQNQLIELQNGYIVLSLYSGGKIVVINPINYSVIKEINEQEYITYHSSLCCWGNNSFIYVYDGKILQFKIDDCTIIFKTKMENQLFGHHCTIAMTNGIYLIIENKSNGLTIVKPY